MAKPGTRESPRRDAGPPSRQRPTRADREGTARSTQLPRRAGPRSAGGPPRAGSPGSEPSPLAAPPGRAAARCRGRVAHQPARRSPGEYGSLEQFRGRPRRTLDIPSSRGQVIQQSSSAGRISDFEGLGDLTLPDEHHDQIRVRLRPGGQEARPECALGVAAAETLDPGDRVATGGLRGDGVAEPRVGAGPERIRLPFLSDSARKARSPQARSRVVRTARGRSDRSHSLAVTRATRALAMDVPMSVAMASARASMAAASSRSPRSKRISARRMQSSSSPPRKPPER